MSCRGDWILRYCHEGCCYLCLSRRFTWLDLNFRLCGTVVRTKSGVLLPWLSPSPGPFPLSSFPGRPWLLLPGPRQGDNKPPVELSPLGPLPQVWLSLGRGHRNETLAPGGLVLVGSVSLPNLPALVCCYSVCSLSAGGLISGDFTPPCRRTVYIINVVECMHLNIHMYLKQKVHDEY